MSDGYRATADRRPVSGAHTKSKRRPGRRQATRGEAPARGQQEEARESPTRAQEPPAAQADSPEVERVTAAGMDTAGRPTAAAVDRASAGASGPAEDQAPSTDTGPELAGIIAGPKTVRSHTGIRRFSHFNLMLRIAKIRAARSDLARPRRKASFGGGVLLIGRGYAAVRVNTDARWISQIQGRTAETTPERV